MMRNKKAYRNKTDMESMSSPFCHQHGKHTWSPLLLTWQAYLVRYKMDIKFWKYGKFTYSLIEKMASKPGPKQNGYGKHAESPV